jgi:hypothetical protein
LIPLGSRPSALAWSLLALSLACGSTNGDVLYEPHENGAGTAGAGAAGEGGAGSGLGGGGAGSRGGTGGDADAIADAGFERTPPEPDAAVLDAGGDAATGDAGFASELGCLPGDQADCELLAAALVHRYSFEGAGTSVQDGVGSADGTLIDAQLAGTGSLALSGGGEFVDLPNGIVSQLNNATFEVWVNWAGGAIWQRIFDFGSTDGAEGTRGAGQEYLFLTPRSSDDTLRVTFLTSQTNGEIRLSSSAALPDSVEKHVVVVLDAQAARLSLYLDNALIGFTPLTDQLSSIGDVNNWLGQSQFASDAAFEGSILEFRIYSAALTANQIALSFDRGPDAPLGR